MSMQSQLVHTLEERAGLDEATAERVAQIAVDFSKEHGSELMSEYAPESMKSMAPSEEGERGTVSEFAAEERVTGSGGEMGWAATERVEDTAGEFAGGEERVSGSGGEYAGAEERVSGTAGGAEERVSGTAEEVGAATEHARAAPGEIGANEERGESTSGETTATEEGGTEHPGGLGGLFSRLTGH